MNSKLLSYLAISALTCTLGCRSFSSTPISRFENDTLAGNSNGDPRHHCNARPHKGVPVKLKVTTHFDVYIKERYCIQQDDLPLIPDPNHPEITDQPKVGTRTITEPLGNTRLMSVYTEPVQSEQVVIVDFKRPGSGSLDMDASFTDQQYFKKITSKIQDNTITDTSELVKSVVKLVGTQKGAGFADIETDTARRKWITKTVAYQRFDINEPDYELRMDEFVNYHLNACNSCGVNQ